MTKLQAFQTKTNYQISNQSTCLKLVICKLIIFLVIGAWLLVIAQTVNAQTLSLSVWPPLLEVMIQPGKTASQVYKITNNSDRPLAVTPLMFEFMPQGEEGQIRILEPKEKTENNFFSFDNQIKMGESFKIDVGQTKELVLKIHAPRQAEEADFYQTLLFSTQADSTISQTKTTAITQIGTNILLTISKDGKPPLLARINEFSAPIIVDSFSPVPLTLRLENWGRTYWKPFGKIILSGLLGQKEELPLLEQNVLAKSTRKINLTPVKPSLPLGPFKAQVEFSPNENGQIFSSEITFWYLPYKIIFTIITAFIIIVLLKKYAMRNTSNGA